MCPPVVEYDQAFRERAAAELELLPDRSNIQVIINDYAVLRDQVRGCSVTPQAQTRAINNSFD